MNHDETAAKVYFIAPDVWAKNENTMQDNNGVRVMLHDLRDGVIKTGSTPSFGYNYEGDARFPATITGKTAEGYTYAGFSEDTDKGYRSYIITIWIEDLFIHTVELRSYAEYDGDLDAYFERVFRPLLESIRYEFSIGELPMLFSNIYNNAEIAYSRFTDCAMMGYTSEKIEYGGKEYLCVSPGIASSLSDLRKITEMYFTSEIVDKLMKTEVDGFPLYVERDGKLYRLEEYSKQVGRSTVLSLEPIGFYNGEYYVRVGSKAQYLGEEYSVHAICKYKLVDGAIYFTEFPFTTSIMQDTIFSSKEDEGTSDGDSPVSVPVPGGDSYVMEDPMDFLPPEAASHGTSVQVGDSYYISYHTYTEEPSVYVALRLENGNYLMMKTALPEEDFVCDGFIKDMWDSGNGSAIAIVRRYQIGLACYTDLVCELSLNACNDAHSDLLDAYYNNRDVYKIPAWELVERKFIFDETAIGAYLPDNAKVVFVKQLLNSPHFLYFCTNEAGTEFMLYHLYANIWGSNPDIGEIERLDVKLPESVKYDTVVPVEYTTGGGSMECKFYLRLMRDSEIFYVSFDNFAWETSEDILDFEYKGIITEKDQRELAGMYPEIFEAPATIVNVAVTVHGDADCEIIFDEDSYGSGMFTRFTLKAGDRTVDFEGRQLNYKDADIYASDLTGDGVNDYTVVFTYGTGTSFLVKEVHVFDGATLQGITVSSPEDYLDENLVQSFDEEHYMLEIDGGKYFIKKSEIPFFGSVREEIVGTNTWLTFHVNGDGELVAVIGCMVGMGGYVGVIEIEYGYTEAGELRPVHAKYIDTLSLEHGINSYYDSIRTQ